MEILYPRCAGLDVHKDTVVACVRCVSEPVIREVRSFGTTTSQLYDLYEWLEQCGVTHVAMEATGIYWKPVWHILEVGFQLVLANAHHIRNVPGRKTDVKDAEWISDLLAHGLIASSFVPPQPIQELRDLTRTRKQIVREVSQHTQRIQKILEDTNIKLSSVLSDTVGVTGRRILNAIIEGETNPQKLAELAVGIARKKQGELAEALRGRVSDHHRRMLKVHLEIIDSLNGALKQLDDAAGKALVPIQERVALLTTIPGVSEITANVIIAEIGIDMSRFPTVAHLISWAGLCPRNDESAGKRKSTKLRHGAPWLKATLANAAHAAARKKDSYLRALYLKISAKRGPKKALIAVAAAILTAAYFMLQRNEPYKDLGAAYLDRRDATKTIKRLTKRIQDLGFTVQVARAA
jgi:transposase